MFTNINLQLFADIPASANTLASTVPTHLNTNVTTDAGLSAEMKTYYDMTLIDEAGPMLVHDQFGQKRNIPANGGKTIEFRQFKNLPKATNPITEGITPNGGKLDVTAKTATVDQYGYYVTQSDVLELTALDNTILEATKMLGKQAGVTLDTITRDVLQSGTNVNYAPKVSGGVETEVTSRTALDGTAKLTVDLVQQIVAKLRANNAPTINGDYVAIIHPYVAYDLMRDPEWIDAHKYAQPENLYEGEIGKIGGVRFVQTTEAKIYAGANLSAAARNLTVASYSSKVVTIDETLTADDQAALVGRKVLIQGELMEIASATATTFTVVDTPTVTPADGDVVYPGEGGANGLAVFASLFLADGAYGTTEVNGGGLQTIVKQKGSAGTADPLDQRSTIGWKALKTAEILIDNYLVRVESCSPRYSATAKEN